MIMNYFNQTTTWLKMFTISRDIIFFTLYALTFSDITWYYTWNIQPDDVFVVTQSMIQRGSIQELRQPWFPMRSLQHLFIIFKI